jgi:hypothetical protein
MSIRNLGQIVLTAVIAFGFAGTAFADGHEEGYPISVSERPLTLDEGQMNASAALSILKASDALTIRVGYGVMENLTVNATIAPLSLGLVGGEFGFGTDKNDPSLGATYRFVDGDFEVAGNLSLDFPVKNTMNLSVGVPVAYHMDALRIGASVGVKLSGLDGDTMKTTIEVPVSIGYNVTGDMHVAVTTGLSKADIDDLGGTMAIPVGLGLVYTIADGEAPMVDIGLGFALPNVENTDIWAVGLTGNFHLWL